MPARPKPRGSDSPLPRRTKDTAVRPPANGPIPRPTMDAPPLPRPSAPVAPPAAPPGGGFVGPTAPPQLPGWVHALNFLGQLHQMSGQQPNFQAIGASMAGGNAAPPQIGAPGILPGAGGAGRPTADVPVVPTPPMPSPTTPGFTPGTPTGLSGGERGLG